MIGPWLKVARLDPWPLDGVNAAKSLPLEAHPPRA